jgi:hypothetical protein
LPIFALNGGKKAWKIQLIQDYPKTLKAAGLIAHAAVRMVENAIAWQMEDVPQQAKLLMNASLKGAAKLSVP